jgi:hypothetical protein
LDKGQLLRFTKLNIIESQQKYYEKIEFLQSRNTKNLPFFLENNDIIQQIKLSLEDQEDKN